MYYKKSVYPLLLFSFQNNLQKFSAIKRKLRAIIRLQTRRKKKREEKILMSKSSNRIVVPEAKEAMNRFKMEAANE